MHDWITCLLDPKIKDNPDSMFFETILFVRTVIFALLGNYWFTEVTVSRNYESTNARKHEFWHLKLIETVSQQLVSILEEKTCKFKFQKWHEEMDGICIFESDPFGSFILKTVPGIHDPRISG